MFPKTTVLGNFYIRGPNNYTKFNLILSLKPNDIKALIVMEYNLYDYKL